MSRWRRIRRPLLAFLALGLALEIVISLASTAFVDLASREKFEARSLDDDGVLWRVTVQRGIGGTRFTSVRERGAAWSPQRATGPPDTPGAGDLSTAWASATPDGADEWIDLVFGEPVIAASVRVFESFNPGAVTRVGVFDGSGHEQVIAIAGENQQPSGIRVSRFDLNGPRRAVRRVKVYVDSRAVPGWNEIDAVCLVDDDGFMHWATAARASSSYASGTQTTTVPADRLAPSWSDFHVPSAAFSSGAAAQERRVIEARGWPAHAFRGLEDDVANPAAMARAVPLRPIWFNLLADAVILGAALWLLWLTLTRPMRFLVESSRARRGSCPRCGYDLQFDLKHGCPECGWRRDGEATSPSPIPMGEGWGEGSSPSARNSQMQKNPHPSPLPEYRERG